jgi:DNA-binding CsgD family transcriptional regulator
LEACGEGKKMSVDPSKNERLISSIYDAAIDGRRWDEALLVLAEASECAQASLEFYDRDNGHMRAYNPLSPPEFRQPFFEHWLLRFPHWRKTARFPVGQLVRRTDVMDLESVLKSDFYNDWMKPQGIGADSRFANLASTGRANVRLWVTKPDNSHKFTAADDALLRGALPHFIRALGIYRRLRLGRGPEPASGALAVPSGFVVVDRDGAILAAHEPTRRRLYAAGLISCSAPEGRAGSDDGLEYLISGAASWGAVAATRAGQVERRGVDGALLTITVIPVQEGVASEDPWLVLDRPAALLHVSSPADVARERVAALAARYGLTAAEAVVAVETAKGDGRAAVAARLGIRETTVRSHLSAIFDKLGIHRQAELAHLVSGA